MARGIKNIYYKLVQGEKSLGHVLLLLLRLYWGSLFVLTGVGKLLNLQQTSAFFHAHQVPYPLLLALLVGVFECIGGLSLILGFCSRILALILAIILFFAYAYAHTQALNHIFTHPQAFIEQDPFLYLLTALLVLSWGPGFFSIDYWLEKKAFGRSL